MMTASKLARPQPFRRDSGFPFVHSMGGYFQPHTSVLSPKYLLFRGQDTSVPLIPKNVIS
jgi:hypothetical protein